MEIRPGLFVLAVPVIWKLKEGEDDTPENVCAHVARETFGPHARLWTPSTIHEAASVYAEALAKLEAACAQEGRTCELDDPLSFIVNIGPKKTGNAWASGGLRYLVVVEVAKDRTH